MELDAVLLEDRMPTYDVTVTVTVRVRARDAADAALDAMRELESYGLDVPTEPTASDAEEVR